MSDREFKGGWKTLLDGTREPITEAEADCLWRAVEEADKRRAEIFPTTVDALRGFIDAEQRMKSLGWKSHSFGVQDGAELAVCQKGSTGIWRAFYQKPYVHYSGCVGQLTELFWKEVGDLTQDELAHMERCDADAKNMMEVEIGRLQRMSEYLAETAGDTHE